MRIRPPTLFTLKGERTIANSNRKTPVMSRGLCCMQRGLDSMLGFDLHTRSARPHPLHRDSIWHFLKSRWPIHGTFPRLEIFFLSVCAVVLLVLFGGLFKMGFLLLWLSLRSFVDHYRKNLDDWVDSTQSRRMLPVEIVSLLLWGILGLGILWGIRACSRAIFGPDGHPPAYHDPDE
jgi:hypothetical protein